MLLGFTRALRAAGVPVTQDRSHAFLEATALVGLDDRRATYWAGRATLCAGPDDLARYDQVFEAWFDPRGEPPAPARQRRPALLDGDRAAQHRRRRARATPTRTTRCSAPKATDLRRAAAPRRGHPGRRREAAARRDVRDPAAAPRPRVVRPGTSPGTAATSTRRARCATRCAGWASPATSPGGAAGAPAPHRAAGRRERLDERVRRRAAAPRPPLRHRPSRGGVEIFTLGTRLTHVTRALHHRDPDRAIVAAGEAVPDWSGGTRLGETLRVFLDRWGQRGMARGCGRRGLQRRLGARRRGAPRRADGAAAAGRPPGRVGQPAPRQGRLRAGAAGHRGGPPALSTTSWPATRWRPSPSSWRWSAVRDVLGELMAWWEAGETVGVGTVVATFSSAPRPPGASMLVGPDGTAVGSVSGGCVEGAVYELGQAVVDVRRAGPRAVRRLRRRRLRGRPDLRRHPRRVRREGLARDLPRARRDRRRHRGRPAGRPGHRHRAPRPRLAGPRAWWSAPTR